MRFRFAIFLAASLAVLTARAADIKKPKDDPEQIGERGVGKCVNFYPIEMEIELGRLLANDFRPHDRVKDLRITEFVNRVGQNVARHSDLKIPIVFQEVKGDNPNAFAFPGGFVFINTGMLRRADEEDELAAILGHQIAHVAARHLTCRLTKVELLQMLAAPAVNATTRGRLPKRVKTAASTAALTALSVADEAEADYLGVQYSYAAGYDPSAAVSLFEKFSRLHPDNLLCAILGKHPLFASRIEKTQKEIQSILAPRPDYLVSTSEYREVRERVITLEDRPDTLKDSPKHGNPAPKVQRKSAIG